jgi:formylglycine-generating enzyme required for sulfatase activity
VNNDDPNVACIPSAAFVFGSPRLGNVNITSTMPDRFVRTSRFFIDRHEVTVKRYRQALSDGLARPDNAALRTDHKPSNVYFCTFYDAPGPTEDLAINCITWDAARAFCQFRGGDLPTEPQWEHAATGGRPYDSRYPWGDSDPTCDRADYGRAFPDMPGFLLTSTECIGAAGLAPSQPLDESAFGVFDLAGGVTEWTRDTGVSLSDDCWRLAPSIDPSCMIATDSRAALRGGSWLSPSTLLDSAARDITQKSDQQNAQIGFRCVYSTLPSWR